MSDQPDVAPSWIGPVFIHAQRLFCLCDGWDGYSARRPDPVTVIAALGALTAIMSGILDPQPPSVVPLADGGVQFEWHTTDGDFEIEFSAKPGEPAGYYHHNNATGEEHEGPLDVNVDVRKYIPRN